MSRKAIVYLLTALALIGFFALLYFGWVFRWGAQTEDTGIREQLVLTLSRMERALELAPRDFDDEVWRTLRPLAVPLLYQVTEVPWGRSLVPELAVSAFHDGKDVYFLLEWDDEMESRAHGVGEFPDGVAVAFSLAEEPPRESIMMGFKSMVNIWQWKADLDESYWSGVPADQFSSNKFYTYEEPAAFSDWAREVSSACQNLIAERPGSLTWQDKNQISGRGLWSDGRWHILLKRPLTTDNASGDVQLGSARRVHVAFAVWNGDKGDRGSRKSISNWVILDIKTGAGSTADGQRQSQTD